MSSSGRFCLNYTNIKKNIFFNVCTKNHLKIREKDVEMSKIILRVWNVNIEFSNADLFFLLTMSVHFSDFSDPRQGKKLWSATDPIFVKIGNSVSWDRLDKRIMSEVSSHVVKLGILPLQGTLSSCLGGKLIKNIYVPPEFRAKTGFTDSLSGRIFELNSWGSSVTYFL